MLANRAAALVRLIVASLFSGCSYALAPSNFASTSDKSAPGSGSQSRLRAYSRSGLLSADGAKGSGRSATRGLLFGARGRRGILAMALVLNFFVPPPPEFAISQATQFAASAIASAVLPVWNLHSVLVGLSRSRPARKQRETMADRKSRVAVIQTISPQKFTGYQQEAVGFTAIAADASGVTVQGVRFEWESSDTNKVAIDDSGVASLLSPGLAWITCRAGTITAQVPVLVKPGGRPAQTHQQWDSDQSSLSATGAVGG